MRAHNLKNLNGSPYLLEKDAKLEHAIKTLNVNDIPLEQVAHVLLSFASGSATFSGKQIVTATDTQPTEITNGLVFFYDLTSKTSEDTITVPPLKKQYGYVITTEIWFYTGNSVPKINWPAGTIWIDEIETDKAPNLSPNKLHCFSIRHLGLRTPDKTIAALQSIF